VYNRAVRIGNEALAVLRIDNSAAKRKREPKAVSAADIHLHPCRLMHRDRRPNLRQRYFAYGIHIPPEKACTGCFSASSEVSTQRKDLSYLYFIIFRKEIKSF
jgi:hypothetical protein